MIPVFLSFPPHLFMLYINTQARAVYLYFIGRLEGKEEAEAATTAANSILSSASTVRNFAAECGDIGGFHETKSGKYTRKNVFGNPHLMYAMKSYIEANQYKVGSSFPPSSPTPALLPPPPPSIP